MSGWLAPLEEVLSEAVEPVPFFFRDDDAGWGTARLRKLLDVFALTGAAIDLAVIPAAIERPLARELAARRRSMPGRLGLHQHGLRHANHEPTGRKCEFGAARRFEEQRADIERGRDLLAALLELEPDPIFTPPWNRCTAETGRAVLKAGLRVLSTESRAPALGLDELIELPVTVDWLAHRRGTRLTPAEMGVALAAHARAAGSVGVMLHHAVMGESERQGIADLLALLARADGASFATMTELSLAGAAA